MFIKKSKKNQLTIEFKNTNDIQLILATAKYIENSIKDRLLTDEYTDMLDIFNTKEYPNIEYTLFLNFLYL